MANKCFFYGRMVNDPDVKYSEVTKKAVVNFSIAVRREYKNKEGKYDSDFFNCTAFDKKGELIGNNFSKGSRICVWGQMHQDRWQDKDGNNRTTYKLYVEGFEFPETKSAKTETPTSFDDIGTELEGF